MRILYVDSIVDPRIPLIKLIAIRKHADCHCQNNHFSGEEGVMVGIQILLNVSGSKPARD